MLSVSFDCAVPPKKASFDLLVPKDIVPAPIYRLYHGIDALPRLCAYSDDDAAGTNCREELSVAELLVPLPISLSVVVDVLGADAHSTA